MLFVNGIPLVVAEFKSPGIQNPLQEAINQLLRYSNQRRELYLRSTPRTREWNACSTPTSS